MAQIKNWDKLDNNALKTSNISYKIHIPPNQFYQYVNFTQQNGFIHYEYYGYIIDQYKEVQLDLRLQIMSYKKQIPQILLKISLPASVTMEENILDYDDIKDINRFKKRIEALLDRMETKVIETQTYRASIKHLYPNAF
jgi:hypothetical protein